MWAFEAPSSYTMMGAECIGDAWRRVFVILIRRREVVTRTSFRHEKRREPRPVLNNTSESHSRSFTTEVCDARWNKQPFCEYHIHRSTEGRPGHIPVSSGVGCCRLISSVAPRFSRILSDCLWHPHSRLAIAAFDSSRKPFMLRELKQGNIDSRGFPLRRSSSNY